MKLCNTWTVLNLQTTNYNTGHLNTKQQSSDDVVSIITSHHKHFWDRSHTPMNTAFEQRWLTAWQVDDTGIWHKITVEKANALNAQYTAVSWLTHLGCGVEGRSYSTKLPTKAFVKFKQFKAVGTWKQKLLGSKINFPLLYVKSRRSAEMTTEWKADEINIWQELLRDFSHCHLVQCSCNCTAMIRQLHR